MFCKNCGKELSNDENFCSKCGFKILNGTILKDTTSSKDTKKKKKGQITGIGQGMILILFLIILGIIINLTTAPTNTTTSSVNCLIDVTKFYKTASQTISINELISMNGEPENREEWNYTNSVNSKIPLVTLSYENSTYEYIFKDDMLIRININKNITFNSQKDIFTMFNLKQHDSTQIKNTGAAIRIYNSSVPDFWCGYTDKNIEWIKITFINGVFD